MLVFFARAVGKRAVTRRDAKRKRSGLGAHVTHHRRGNSDRPPPMRLLRFAQCARAEAPGWSTLVCCSRRPAGNTGRRMCKHTGLSNLCVFKFVRRPRTHARRVSAAGRRRQHSGRVLHPRKSRLREVANPAYFASGFLSRFRWKNSGYLLRSWFSTRFTSAVLPSFV